MSSPYLTGSLSSGKTPSCGCELEPRGGVAWLLLQDGRSSRDGGGHRDSELPSKTMPAGQAWGSLLGEKTAGKKAQLNELLILRACGRRTRPTLDGCPTYAEPLPGARTHCGGKVGESAHVELGGAGPCLGNRPVDPHETTLETLF